MDSDLLLCRSDYTPVLRGQQTVEEWVPATVGSGEFHLAISFKPMVVKYSIEQFELLKVVGKGSFGNVMQVKKKDTQRIYALKAIRKAHTAPKPGEITHVMAEETVLGLVNNPFIVPLQFSFQNPVKLYLFMSFVDGGELLYYLQREGKFDQTTSRFYAAELFDLKPENILLDYTGHIALCDFGLSFCGTPEYIAPELLKGQGYTTAVDWWTLGILLCEMMTGLAPFYDENVAKMYQRILHDPLRVPEETPSEASSIMASLLERDPSQRLGSRGVEEIKTHPFFAQHIDWERLIQKKIAPPFKPRAIGQIDVSNFSSDFTSDVPMDIKAATTGPFQYEDSSRVQYCL
ncbi:hypothetical protein FRC01_004432 [Tulasnella sp. 417]|nr:hypothetical protein FRC01_004432 [Tulasnella sp. 417]